MPLPPLPEINEGEVYVWECRMYRRDPTAFWFDHNRYNDTPGQYPDPPEWALKKAWGEATKEARGLYGERAVNELFAAMRSQPKFDHPDPSNPFPFLMDHFKIKPSKGRYQTPG